MVVTRSDTELDQGKEREDFGRRLLEIYTGAALSSMIAIGYQTGLFEAAAAGPATSVGLAERAQLEERYVREWLGAMASGGIMIYDRATERYALPPEHAPFLTGHTIHNAAPQSQMLALAATILPDLIACFRQGGGVPYSRFRPAFTQVMDDNWRRIYDDRLIDGFLPAARGLPERLQTGIRVSDVGCGTGHALNLMAREYPASTFVGYDLAEDAIAAARQESESMGLSNVRFEVQDVATLPAETRFDLILAFDAIHDQARPEIVLSAIAHALAPHGIFFMVEHKFSSDLAKNLGNPFAPLYYSLSTFHCMTVSLAEGGAGLGAMWGEETARRMLAEAGFTEVEVVDSPRPQNAIFICRKDKA
jgi:SAM-dependent methyltransferase